MGVLLRSLSEMAVLPGLLSVHHNGQQVVVGLGTHAFRAAAGVWVLLRVPAHPSFLEVSTALSS